MLLINASKMVAFGTHSPAKFIEHMIIFELTYANAATLEKRNVGGNTIV